MLKLAIPNVGRDFLCPFLRAVSQCAAAPHQVNFSTFILHLINGNLFVEFYQKLYIKTQVSQINLEFLVTILIFSLNLLLKNCYC